MRWYLSNEILNNTVTVAELIGSSYFQLLFDRDLTPLSGKYKLSITLLLRQHFLCQRFCWWLWTRVDLNFFFDFGLSHLTSLQFILYHAAWFYKPTIPQSPPSHLQDYSTCNNARLEFSTIFVSSFDPNEWYLKNGLHSGGLNPGPLGHESSALTTGQTTATRLDLNFLSLAV